MKSRKDWNQLFYIFILTNEDTRKNTFDKSIRHEYEKEGGWKSHLLFVNKNKIKVISNENKKLSLYLSGGGFKPIK